VTATVWAEALAGELDPELVAAVVRCAAQLDVTPERLGAVLGRRLRTGAATDARSVIQELHREEPPAERVESAARALLAAEARVLIVGSPGYPPLLAQAWPELGAPAWLFLRGRAVLPEGPAVAVVGTRRPTLDGVRTAQALGRFLAHSGLTVVSGMARGIDQAAHRGALDGGGATVGVLGTGFGVDYPSGDGRLRAAVAASGGLLTEYLPGVPPRPPHFLWRNRIVSGLVSAVVVVEGRARSGALQTARLAAAQGREVFAVPGSLNAPASRGPLDLVRDGARVLTCFEDLLEALDLPPPANQEGVAKGQHEVAEPAAGALVALLGSEPAVPAALAAAAGLPLGDTLATLAELEARGLARYTGRGFVGVS
jgi:DNA processing protein